MKQIFTLLTFHPCIQKLWASWTKWNTAKIKFGTLFQQAEHHLREQTEIHSLDLYNKVVLRFSLQRSSDLCKLWELSFTPSLPLRPQKTEVTSWKSKNFSHITPKNCQFLQSWKPLIVLHQIWQLHLSSAKAGKDLPNPPTGQQVWCTRPYYWNNIYTTFSWQMIL